MPDASREIQQSPCRARRGRSIEKAGVGWLSEDTNEDDFPTRRF
jgi:hypothetical protein